MGSSPNTNPIGSPADHDRLTAALARYHRAEKLAQFLNCEIAFQAEWRAWVALYEASIPCGWFFSSTLSCLEFCERQVAQPAAAARAKVA